MKLSRHDPYRRRRNPASTLLIALLLVVIGLLAWAWSRGGEQPKTQVEIPIPANRLGK